MATQQHGEFVGSNAALSVAQVRRGNMSVEMVDNQLIHQSRHGAANGCDQMQSLRACGIALNRAFDSGYLPSDPAHPRDHRILVL
jgi:hypothetical protein